MYRATEWLHTVESGLPDQLAIRWRAFSLVQVNHEGDPGWRIWDQPLIDPGWQERPYAPSLRAFWGAEAARRQGDEAHRRFHLALLRARHRQGLSLAKPETIQAAAQVAGLELAPFREALEDPSCLQRLARDHTEASEVGVFGTPTLVFPGAEPAYLKLSDLPQPEEALAFWAEFQSIVAGRPYVLEIKRPQ